MPSPIPYIVGGSGGDPGQGFPTSMLAQGLYLPDDIAIDVNDDVLPGVRALSVTTGWYRIFLAPYTGVADYSERKPFDLLRVLEGQLAAGANKWTVRLQRSGRIKITYNGTGTGTLAWSTLDAVTIRDLCGFAGDVVLASGASATAPYPPMGVLYMVSRESCTGWVPKATLVAASRASNGRVSGTTDGSLLLVQRWTSRVHPRTWDEADEYTSYCTPLWPSDARVSRKLSARGPVGKAPPWSVSEFCVTALARRLGMALGTFQELVAGTRTDYEAGYLAPDSARGVEVPKTSGNWKAFHDLKDFEVSLVEGFGTNGVENR